jgi:predicted Zn-dependent protease
MVKLNEYSESVLKSYIEELKNDANYVHCFIEHRKEEEGKFRNGKRYPTTVEYNLGLRITFDSKNQLILSSAMLPEGLPSARISTQDVEYLSRIAKENFIKTDVIIPKKDLPFPSKSYVENPVNFSIPSSFKEEMRIASKNGNPELDVCTKYKLTQRTIYQLDSNGIENLQVLANLYMKFYVYTSPNEKISRGLGITLNKQSNLDNLSTLIKTIPDVTPEQSLRDCSSFSELMSKLADIGKNISENGIKIENGSYDIVTPSSTPFHESLGHSFEGKILFSRKSWDESIYEPNPVTSGLKEIKIPKSLTFVDSPSQTSSMPQGFLQFPPFGIFKYDCEMFPAEEKILIDRGKVTGRMLGSRYSDVNETGNAISSVFSFIPQPRMSFTSSSHSNHGPRTIKEMCEMASKKEKVLLTFNAIGEHLGEDGFVRIGKIGDGEEKELELSPEAYVIRDNKFKPVKTPFHFTLNVYKISDIVLSNRDLYYYDSGYCSISTPTGEEDLIPSSHMGPMILMKDINVITYKKRTQV